MKAKSFKFRPLALSLLLAGVVPLSAVAAPPAGSPYATDVQNSYVHDATSDGIAQLNMVLCIMNAMSPADLVNQGAYVALIDKNKCDTSGRDSASNSSGDASGAESAPDYMKAVVNVTRADTSSPMIGKVWMHMEEQGNPITILVRVTASQSPADVPPYGVFRLDYIGKAGSMTAFNGYIESTASDISYFENSFMGGPAETRALRIAATSTTAGAGSMNNNGQAFDFAYNPGYFRRSDGVDDRCFDRNGTAASRSVWRYGTYDDTTGERVDQANPGFPINASYNGASHYGFASYWGIHFQDLDLNAIADAQPIIGLTISDQRPNSTATYSLSKVSGKLTKWTQQSSSLAAMDGIPFIFNGDLTGKATGNSAVTGFDNWRVTWNNTAGTFTVTGKQNCGQNGCVVADISPTATITTNALDHQPVNGWSDSFGGNINLPPTGSPHTGTDPVYFYTQSVVFPGTTVPTLYCLSRCPTATSMAAFTGSNSPFDANTEMQWFSAPSTASTVSYSFGAGGLMEGSTVMVDTNASHFGGGGMYSNGIMTGRLFESAPSHTNCPQFMTGSEVCEEPNPSVYYTWQTGPNQWDQAMWLTPTGSSTPVALDPPQNVHYTVTAQDDTSQSAAWVGKSIQLQFNGFGNLWGLPGNCVDPVDNSVVSCGPNVRFVPSFALHDGATMSLGSSTLIVKALDAEMRLSNVPLSTCTGANLNLNPQTPPTSAGLHDPSSSSDAYYIDVEPTPVLMTPKVIHGVVQ